MSEIINNKELLEIYTIELSEIIATLKSTTSELHENPLDEEARKLSYVNYHKLKGNSAIIGLEYLRQFCYLFEMYLKKNLELNDDFLKLLSSSIDIFTGLYTKYQKGEFIDLDKKLLDNYTQQIKEL